MRVSFGVWRNELLPLQVLSSKQKVGALMREKLGVYGTWDAAHRSAMLSLGSGELQRLCTVAQCEQVRTSQNNACFAIESWPLQIS